MVASSLEAICWPPKQRVTFSSYPLWKYWHDVILGLFSIFVLGYFLILEFLRNVSVDADWESRTHFNWRCVVIMTNEIKRRLSWFNSLDGLVNQILFSSDQTSKGVWETQSSAEVYCEDLLLRKVVIIMRRVKYSFRKIIWLSLKKTWHIFEVQ